MRKISIRLLNNGCVSFQLKAEECASSNATGRHLKMPTPPTHLKHTPKQSNELIFQPGEPEDQIGWNRGSEAGQGSIERRHNAQD